MAVKRGAVIFNLNALHVPLKEGDLVPCPKCAAKHFVQRDPRPGTALDLATGEQHTVRNEALFVECPEAPGPIIVGMEGFVLPEPIELTPRKARS